MFKGNLKCLIILGILVTSLFLPTSLSAKSDPLLEEGVNAFQQGRWEVAREKFLKLSEEGPWKFAALYNLGNTALRQKHFGEALGFYKRAQALNPHDGDLLANIKFVVDSSGFQSMASNKGNLELFRREVLNRFTFDEFLGAFLLLSIFFLGALFKYLKIARLVEGRPPLNAFLPISAILFLSCFIMASLKLVDTYSDRGTIIIAKEDLRSGPNNQNASLLELSEGLEVKVIDDSNGWRQVTYPNGVTGWIPESSIMITSGWGPW